MKRQLCLWRTFCFIKVSRSQNKIVEPQILPKNKRTKSFVCFLVESVAWQFCFEIYWPLARAKWGMGLLLKSRVGEICVKRIRVNQGVGVYPNSWQYPLKNALIEPIGIAHIHSRTYTQLLWLNWCWYRLSKFSDVLSLACVLYTGLYLLLQPCNLATIFYNAQPNTYVGYV